MSQMNIVHHDAPAPTGNIQTFRFTDTLILRGFLRDGEPWFVAQDVSEALEYRNAPDMTRNLDDDEKGTQIVRTLGGDQEMTVINESGLYSAILKSRKPEAKTFKKWVTSEVLPSIRKTGSYAMPAAPAIAHTPLTHDIAALELAARVLNVSESGKLGMVRHAFQHHAPHLLPALPGYAVDAPRDVVVASGSSMVTASATSLLKKHGISMSPAKFNERLCEYGLLAQAQRQGKGGTFKKFWCVTPSGESYGKNITSPVNQRETQPHWYVDRFSTLLAGVGLA